MFPDLLVQYLYTNPRTGKSSRAYLLMIMWPGIVLGGLNGWLGCRRWTSRMLMVNAFVISLLVDALIPFSRQFIKEAFRGSPVGASIGSFMITCFCTFFVYVQREERDKGRDLP